MAHLNLTFTDAPGTPLPTHDAKWVPYTGSASDDLQIRDNAARRQGGGAGPFYYNEQLGSTNFSVEWSHKVTSLADGRGGVLINANAAASADGYLFRSDVADNKWDLFKLTGGNFSLVSSKAFTFAVATYSCRIERDASNNTMRLLVDGSEILTNTDADYKANDRIGLRLSSGLNIYIDDVVTADLVAQSTPDYTQRKGSTWDATHGLGTITTATLNGNAITVNSTGAGTVNLTDTSGIATSGEYDLVLGDGTGTETYTVQLNVVGLTSYTIQKGGAPQPNLSDVEFIVLTGVAGSRAIKEQITGVTTDASGKTDEIEISELSLGVGDPVTVVQQSSSVGGGLLHTATLVAIYC